jgi:F0F1-type ATP synthase assembly protein I
LFTVKDRQHAKESQAGKNRRQGAVYQGAFEAVIALLIAVGFGYWLDGYFNTTPWLLLIGTAIGFASFTVRLIRLGRLMKDENPDEARRDDESE